MRRGDPAGQTWRKATAEFGCYVSAELDSRYGAALDLLASKVWPHLWDCNGGIWEPSSGDDIRRKLALAWLGRLLIDECEVARKPRTRVARRLSSPRLSAAKRRKLVKGLQSVAKSLKTGGGDIVKAIAAANRHVVPLSQTGNPYPPGLVSAQMWTLLQSQGRLTASALADALVALAHELGGQDHRASPRNRGEMPETALASALVTWLRVSTGGRSCGSLAEQVGWSYQFGEPDPVGGRPFYEVAEGFLQSAGWQNMTSETIKARLEAKKVA